MKKANLKSMNKQTKSMLITYAMVIAVFIIVEVMVSTGMMSCSALHLFYRSDRIKSLCRISW